MHSTFDRPAQLLQSDPAAQAEAVTPSREVIETQQASSPLLALKIDYKGHERTSELRLAEEMVAQLVLEAQFRHMSLGELVGALITATMKRNLLGEMLRS